MSAWWGENTPRRRVLLGLSLVAVLLLLGMRELDLVGFQLSMYETNGNHVAELTDTGDWKKRNLTIEFVDGPQRSVEHVHRGDSRDPLRVNVEVSRFALSGLSWTPLWKRVSCAFAVRVTSEDATLAGEVSGTIERQVLGVHSARALRDDLRRQVQEYALQPLRR